MRRTTVGRTNCHFSQIPDETVNLLANSKFAGNQTIEKSLSQCAPAIGASLEAVLLNQEPSFEQGLQLASAQGLDLQTLVTVADHLRREIVCATITYVVNSNINFTNVCFAGCRYCADGTWPQAADA